MITIFTDGSSRGNPGPGGWGAIVVSSANLGSDLGSDAQVKELGGHEGMTTNNRMEIQAAVAALGAVSISSSVVEVHSDSSYVINGITKWVHGWVKKGWISSQKEPVSNRDLWEALIAAVAQAEWKSGGKVHWKYVGGHVGVEGNERCDEIATSFADGMPVALYSGSLSGYRMKNIFDISKKADAAKAKSKKKSHSKAIAYSYVSSVGGTIQTHANWKECEARVKGVKGAKYKKSLNRTDEAEIIKSFSKI